VNTQFVLTTHTNNNVNTLLLPRNVSPSAGRKGKLQHLSYFMAPPIVTSRFQRCTL